MTAVECLARLDDWQTIEPDRDDYAIELFVNDTGQIVLVLPDGRDSYQSAVIEWPEPIDPARQKCEIRALLEA
jgi:hypothetical protein